MTVSWASAAPEVTPQLLVYPAPHSKKAFKTYNAIRASYTDGLSGEVINATTSRSPVSPRTPRTPTRSRMRPRPTVTFTQHVHHGRHRPFPSPSPASATSAPRSGRHLHPGRRLDRRLDHLQRVPVERLQRGQRGGGAGTPVPPAERRPLLRRQGDHLFAGATTSGSSGVQPAPEVWRDFGLNTQRSAANRPWMPCIGNHEAELDNGPYGYNSYNTRYMLPEQRHVVPGQLLLVPGRLGAVHQPRRQRRLLPGRRRLQRRLRRHHRRGRATRSRPPPTSYNQFYTGTFTPERRRHALPGGATPNAQTQWLETTLAAARAGTTVDWIVVQMHQCACRRRPTTAATPASARPGCPCSTSTRSTWCSTATTTTTSARSRCGASPQPGDLDASPGGTSPMPRAP